MITGKLISTALIFLVAWTGMKVKALTVTGSLAAVAAGFATLAGTGVEGLGLLGAFFASSSLWSNFKGKRKTSMDEKLAKGSTRDWRQVAANGGPAAICSALLLATGNPVWLICFSSAIASANSDTWASEIGPLSKKDPINIHGFKRAERGTSGAVSILGTTASLAGSAFIALLAVYFFRLSYSEGIIIFSFGFMGSILDTLLGAYFQVSYKCKECGFETERPIHCGKSTIKTKGIALLDNDMVNFLSGALAVLGTYFFLL
ncbi:DUF92 domain-containing protein [Bacillus sp. FJAT-27445]|uniref:DUF92 domain-containing protein n=1 Tax=Bacillus sp. FJAT-27445 TaxID=1679166 RepID=UPI0009E827BA|nr:DUF92 domain-containing protein [Bacillus sp. FJAT-27445]